MLQNGQNRDSVEVLIREWQGLTVQVHGLRLEPPLPGRFDRFGDDIHSVEFPVESGLLDAREKTAVPAADVQQSLTALQQRERHFGAGLASGSKIGSSTKR